MTGFFITFEGVEGSGKTTQIALLRTALERAGRRVCTTREPGGDALAEAVRRLVLHEEMTPRAELLLFLASRAQNVERVIRPELASGAVVISDRFADSSTAYQGCGRGLGRDEVTRLNGFATGGLLPDITFLLDLDAAAGLSRQSQRNRMEGEALAFHERVRKGFLVEAENDKRRFCVLDAAQSQGTIHRLIWERLAENSAIAGP